MDTSITSERDAKEELSRREERFRSLTALSSDWFWETDENHRFTFVSESVQRLFGIAPKDFLGKTRHEMAVDPDQLPLQLYFEKVVRREAFKDIRYAASGPVPGVVRYASLSGEPVYRNGVFQGFRGIGRDVTEEIEVAQQLARLAEENKALIDNSLDIMTLIDRESRFLRVNGTVQRILGYEPSEMLGRRFLEFVVQEDRDTAKVMEAGMRDGKSTVEDFESRWIRKDGGIVHLSWSARQSEDKRVIYANARDVTVRHHTRLALQRSRDALVTVLESIGDAFFAVDRDWRVTYANRKATAFVGLTQQAVIGKILWDLAPELLLSDSFAHYQKAMATGRPAFFETRYEPARAWVEVRIFPHREGLSVYFQDVTARRTAEAAIRDSEQRFREVIEMTPAGYVLADAQACILEVNPALCAVSGHARAELIGQSLGVLFSACPLNGAMSLQGGATSVHGREALVRHKQGHDVCVLINANIRRDEDGNALFLTAFLTDITERKQAEARLERLATHDTLTGLPNRTLLNERLQQMMHAASDGDSVAVLFIDLDRFKEINDSLGHAQGDALLRKIGRRLQEILRPEDIVARLGGDEFVVAAGCPDGQDSAARIAERLCAALAAPVEIAGQEVFVGASIGISLFPQDATSRELLFQHADTAMYQAKAAGRNGFRFFEAEMSIQAKTRMMLEHSLPRALERQEFELHYQPRVDLDTMGIVGMEALIRWNHPQLGRVPPLQFIPIAEERGLIESIGLWVLEEASTQARRLTDKYRRPLRVSVNLSARQLKSADIVGQVEACLRKAGLPPHLLELELTESALIEDMDVSAAILQELKQLGIQLSVDDFGTGYSGLAYLRRFPLDTLKLDRSFVTGQGDEHDSFRFVKAFVDLAHALNLSVVAEGIESCETLRFLHEASCDQAQGYLFARPLVMDDFEALLSQAGATGFRT